MGEAAEELTAGELLIDRFRLLSPLGKGGFASVWLAEDTRSADERKVAVKVLSAKHVGHKDLLDRFVAEAQLLCAMDHPTIAKAFDVHAADGLALYAMEFVEGSSLKAELERRARASKRFEARESLEIAFSLAAALDHAHRHRIVHRDLKPANVLLPPDGRARGVVAKLVDFGIAKDLGKGEATTQGRFFGSWAYMAPEQVRGVGISERTDVFGLACVVFEVLTLRRAWLRDANGAPQSVLERSRIDGVNGPLAICERIGRGARPVPSTVRPDLPAALDGVFQAGFAVDPAARTATPTAFVTALARALGVPPEEWPVILSQPPRRVAGLEVPEAPAAATVPLEVVRAANAKTEVAAPYVAPERETLPPVLPTALSASDFAEPAPMLAPAPAPLGPGLRFAKEASVPIASLDDWGGARQLSAARSFAALFTLTGFSALLLTGKLDEDRSVIFFALGILSLALALRMGLEVYGNLRAQKLRGGLERWEDAAGLRYRVMGEEPGRGLVLDVFGADARVRLRLRLYPHWRRALGKLPVRLSTDLGPDASKLMDRAGEWRAFPLEKFVKSTVSQLPGDATTRARLEDARSRLVSSEVERIESDGYQVACEARITASSAERLADELAALVRSFLAVVRLLEPRR